MPSDAHGHAPDVHAFDNAISQAFEKQAERLRNYQNLEIRNEVEVRQHEKEVGEACAQAEERFGTSELDALRGITQQHMSTARELEAGVRGDLDRIDREYNLAMNDDTDQQG